ncbi:MAG: hypothetical protein JWP77_2631 [Polaromonas sp.]|nr:hypothetical protein [Polaromonas sp.]
MVHDSSLQERPTLYGEWLHIPVDQQVTLRAWVMPNPQASARVIVCHGNGLASFGYRVFWEALYPEHEVVVFDLRGHGMSDAGEGKDHDFPQFAADMQKVLTSIERAYGARFTVGALHSLSGTCSLLHMRHHAHPWDALALFDLSLSPPEQHPLFDIQQAETQQRAANALKRRDYFKDPAALAAQFSRADRVGVWLGDAPMDMAKALLKRQDQGWRLSCAPEREAKIYLGNANMGLWEELAAASCPTLLIGADPTWSHAQMPSQVCRAAHEATGSPYTYVPCTGHFLQQEAPQKCRDLLGQFIRASQQTSIAVHPPYISIIE